MVERSKVGNFGADTPYYNVKENVCASHNKYTRAIGKVVPVSAALTTDDSDSLERLYRERVANRPVAAMFLPDCARDVHSDSGPSRSAVT